jgi:hypothetical protein
MNPRYPVYIISKGRADTRLTAKSLEYMNVPYHIVIEPQEYLQYAKVINSRKILVLPFKNLGQGSIPARNWVWEHAKATGAKRHWILDDNIAYFFRLNRNLKVPVNSGTIFRAAEDFVDRYTNVGMAGFQYFMFASRKTKMAPFILNTRIYSCILIDNSLDLRWRGKYNEDTDLSIRVLKQGLCTILFNSFLCGKSQTGTMKGGNTDELYKDWQKHRREMAESLVRQHPEIVRVDERWGRPQHVVDYSGFKANKLIFRKGFKLDDLPEVDNYGMELIEFNEGKTSIRKNK